MPVVYCLDGIWLNALIPSGTNCLPFVCARGRPHGPRNQVDSQYRKVRGRRSFRRSTSCPESATTGMEDEEDEADSAWDGGEAAVVSTLATEGAQTDDAVKPRKRKALVRRKVPRAKKPKSSPKKKENENLPGVIHVSLSESEDDGEEEDDSDSDSEYEEVEVEEGEEVDGKARTC